MENGKLVRNKVEQTNSIKTNENVLHNSDQCVEFASPRWTLNHDGLVLVWTGLYHRLVTVVDYFTLFFIEGFKLVEFEAFLRFSVQLSRTRVGLHKVGDEAQSLFALFDCVQRFKLKQSWSCVVYGADNEVVLKN